MVRAAELMAAVHKKAYDRAHEMVTDWYVRYPKVAIEMDMHVAH